jgi:hypothetical protein
MSSGSGNIYTADSTFESASFSMLNSLDLEGVKFAVSGMSSGSGDIFTGSETFYKTTFFAIASLNEIKTDGAIFVAENMTTGTVIEGIHMFSECT